MDRWIQLLKKEIRLGFPAFLLPVFTFIIVAGIAFYFGQREGLGFDCVLMVAVIATWMQIFYLIYYLFYSLQSERKTLHLWLHNPMSAAALLSAKIFAGLVSMLATLVITGGTSLIALTFSNALTIDIQKTMIVEVGFWGAIHIILLAVSLGIGFTFFWIIFLLFTRSFGTFISFLATFVIFIVVASGLERFSNTKVFEALTKWGEFKLENMITSLNVSVGQANAELFTEIGQISLYIGTYVYETIFTLFVFFISCWLLDRKVEV